jgi:hypothetical protein
MGPVAPAGTRCSQIRTRSFSSIRAVPRSSDTFIQRLPLLHVSSRATVARCGRAPRPTVARSLASAAMRASTTDGRGGLRARTFVASGLLALLVGGKDRRHRDRHRGMEPRRRGRSHRSARFPPWGERDRLRPADRARGARLRPRSACRPTPGARLSSALFPTALRPRLVFALGRSSCRSPAPRSTQDRTSRTRWPGSIRVNASPSRCLRCKDNVASTWSLRAVRLVCNARRKDRWV